MARSLAVVAATVALVAGLALADERRDASAADATLAGAPAEPEPEAPAAGLGDTSYLVSCLGSDLAMPESVPPAPKLDPRGVEEVAERMERVRGLRFDGPVDAAFLND